MDLWSNESTTTTPGFVLRRSIVVGIYFERDKGTVLQRYYSPCYASHCCNHSHSSSSKCCSDNGFLCLVSHRSRGQGSQPSAELVFCSPCSVSSAREGGPTPGPPAARALPGSSSPHLPWRVPGTRGDGGGT